MSFGNDDQRGPKLPDNMKSVALVPFVNYIFSNLLEMLTLSAVRTGISTKGARAWGASLCLELLEPILNS